MNLIEEVESFENAESFFDFCALPFDSETLSRIRIPLLRKLGAFVQTINSETKLSELRLFLAKEYSLLVRGVRERSTSSPCQSCIKDCDKQLTEADEQVLRLN